MRTDLKLNYNVLDLISGKLSRCYTAIENMQVELANLEELLEEQDSQAYETEAKKIQSTNMFFGKRKTTIKMLKESVDDYIADMEEKVGAANRSLMVRADKLDIWYNMKTMDGLADDLYDECKNIITGMDYPVPPTEDEETKQIRLRAERNYQKVENLRKNTLVPLSNFIKDKMEDVWDIYDTYIVPFEETDNDYRKKINTIYEKRTSEEDKKSNNWDFGLKVASAFVKGFGLAFVGAVALTLAPGWLAVGIIAALAVGSVVMVFVPKQYVPSWMQGAKDAADNMAELSVRALDEGPLVYVEAIGQGTMDTIQTPEGIAAVTGASVGGVLGGVAGTWIKSKISKPKVRMEDREKLNPFNKTKDVDVEEPEVPKKTDVDEDLPQTEKNTPVEGGTGAQGVGNPVAVEGRGNTGRTIPNTLNEQMAMNQVQSNPLEGATKVPLEMTDPRWPASEGWVKMQSVVQNADGTKTTIHYVYNEITGAFDDFKFK